MNKQHQLSNVTKDYLTAFHCILDEMIQGMTEAQLTDSISHNFIRQMIRHHRAAVEMSKNVLQFGICPELKPIIDAIISSQQRGIVQMRCLLQCMGC